MKYLFATDGSDTSKKAFELLLRLVRKSKDSVVLLNVADLDESSGAQGRSSLHDCETDLRLQKVACECVQREGVPRDIICELVRREQIDMVVIGSVGMGRLGKRYTKMGSTAQFVATHTKAATLIVKP